MSTRRRLLRPLLGSVFLGLKAGGHDAAAAIVREDGTIAAAIAEERLDRVKHSHAFPSLAIHACADEAGIAFSDLHGIFVPYRYPRAVLGAGVLPALRYRGATLRGAASLARRVRGRQLGAERTLREMGSRAPVLALDHHDCHATAAYLTSPFDRATIVTIDGRGERASVRIYAGSGRQIRRVRTVGCYPHSVGLLYSAVTHHLGFEPNGDEGKVMALASYGDANRFGRLFDRLLTYRSGRVTVDLCLFAHYKQPEWSMSDALVRETIGQRQPGDDLLAVHADLAAGLQQRVGLVAAQIVRDAVAQAGSRNVCLSGGVALNSVINGQLVTHDVVDRLHIQSAPADDGAALGAALSGFARNISTRARSRGRPRPAGASRSLASPFLGPSAPAEASRTCVRRFLARARGGYGLHTGGDKLSVAAQYLAAGAVVGLFEGRAEFGPRALGHRSILADPSRPGITHRLNRTVKFREPFRPFGVAALAEASSDLVNGSAPSPHMSMVFQVRPAARRHLAGVAHVDGSVRLQTVDRDGPAGLRRLLELFYELTGIPALVNTSMNVKGQPIVQTAGEALECLHLTGMDALLLGDWLVAKDTPSVDLQPPPPSNRSHRDQWLERGAFR